ncbi:MAG: LD-carboxypeptidase [Gemmatimonadota bacterium]
MGSKPLARPPALAPGNRIGLVSPAGPLLERDDLIRGEELCRALGFEPVTFPHAGGKYGYLAGTDEERLTDLNAALADPTLSAIWCLRGGYGMTRILDRVDFAGLSRAPKAVIGYSDITALLSAIVTECGLVAFHGPMARTSLGSFSQRHFARLLTSSAPAGHLERLVPPAGLLIPKEPRVFTLVPGIAEGRLAGGNLTLLHCLVGTRYFPDLDGALLFLEDIGEDLYAVDRMLAHLRMIGALKRLAGVIVGRFTEMDRGTGDGALGFDEVLLTYFGPLGIPVAAGFPIGHIDEQWFLPLGVRARLDAGAGEVEILEAAVG